ncbi:metal-dependent hydrolase [Desulfonema ishimotonii]|uniref:Metal-dependent hydrolase n=1 Tax=Desulfonema ishimotonii TaxID=45657 RepID=A0A401G243_9BACT|nr:metal-dependent hydrolase [Desulfonema ishimotonii]GBC63302.1 metal-dependent hydrolase [Desulfonema ishimotonii]
MANFKTHLSVACVASGLVATCLLAGDVARPAETVLCFALGSAGGTLPDIDSDNSVPLRLTFDLLSFFIAFLVMFSQPAGDSVVELLLIWGIAFLSVKYLVFYFFTRLTAHRGIFHSVPAGGVFWFLTTILLHRLFNFPALTAWMGGAFVFFGYLVHLVLDEIYSIDFSKMALKTSSGTALKLVSFYDMKATVFMYTALIGLFFLMPDYKPFLDTFLNPATWAGIRFLP